jgi:hypothetical protein
VLGFDKTAIRAASKKSLHVLTTSTLPSSPRNREAVVAGGASRAVRSIAWGASKDDVGRAAISG